MGTFLYNPELKPKTELIAEFVVRTNIYDDILHDLETSKMKGPEQHYLLVGQRGSGKTTLLNRLKYGIEDSAGLHDRLIPILFNEEQYNISELVNLWENVAQYLEDYHGFEGLYDQMEANISRPNFEELSYDILEKKLKTRKKKLVLLIDNIGDMLKKMDILEVRRLREILQTHSELRLIVGSPFYLETLLDYSQPLFEFFKVIRLDALSEKETQLLLVKLAEINGEKEKIEKIIAETPERIETLRTLTGGVPRTIALMFNIFVEFNNQDSVKDLEKILDAVTPLYKHRMDDLPTQQQKIVDAVAKNWDGISVKDLKGKLRMEGKIISAQLKQLQKNQIIDAVDTNTKNNIYRLRERFFNIWYLMRYGRKYDKQRVIWLVKFLESWCTVVELEQRILDYAKKIKDGALNEDLVNFYGEVYTAMSNMRPEMKMILKESTPEYLSARITIEDNELIRMGIVEMEKHQHAKGVELFSKVQDMDYEASIQVSSALANLVIKDHKYFWELSGDLIKKITDEDSTINLSHFETILLFVSFIFLSAHELAKKRYPEAASTFKMATHLISANNKLDERLLTFLIESLFIQFLKYRQGYTVLTAFEERPVLKDKLKPLYYATLIIYNKEDEILKMVPEISEKANEIVRRVTTFHDRESS